MGNTSIKAIILTMDNNIEILKYPNSQIINDKIQFKNPSYYSKWLELGTKNLNIIRETDWGDFVIYTDDYDENNEDKYIEQLIDYALNKCIKHIEYFQKTKENLLKLKTEKPIKKYLIDEK
jgi:hypothetical protein